MSIWFFAPSTKDNIANLKKNVNLWLSITENWWKNIIKLHLFDWIVLFHYKFTAVCKPNRKLWNISNESYSNSVFLVVFIYSRKFKNPTICNDIDFCSTISIYRWNHWAKCICSLKISSSVLQLRHCVRYQIRIAVRPSIFLNTNKIRITVRLSLSNYCIR